MRQTGPLWAMAAVRDSSQSLCWARIWPRALVVALFSLALYTALALSLYQREEPFGDEAAYLLLAHSLAFDGDVDLRNNIEQKDYLAFFHQPEQAGVEPAYDYRGDGTWRSMHGAGLPLLLAIPYRLGGRLGVSLAMAGWAAAMATALFLAACSVSNNLAASCAAWFLFSFTLPIWPYAGKAFTEVPAAALAMLSLCLLLLPGRPGRWRLLLCGLALAALPWLHVRYLALCAVILLWAVLHLRRASPRPGFWPRTLPLLAPVGLSLVLLALSFQRWYGSPLPTAPWRIDLGWPWFVFRPPSIFRGAAGPWLDQEYGLFFTAPLYVAALAGIKPLLARRRGLGTAIIAALAGLALPASAFVLWWGGDCPPVRLLLPALPLLGIPFALALSSWRNVGFRLPLLLFALLAVAGAVLVCVHPDWFHGEDDDRVARVLRELGWERWAPLFPSLAVREVYYGAVELPRGAGEVTVEQNQQVAYSGPGLAEVRVQRLATWLPRGRWRIACRMLVVPQDAEPGQVLAVLRLVSLAGEVRTVREITPADLPPTPRFWDYALEYDLGSGEQLTFELLSKGGAALTLEGTTVGPAEGLVDGPKVALWTLGLAALCTWWNWRGERGSRQLPALAGQASGCPRRERP